MPKIVVEGPDGKKYAFPDTMPRSEINTFMKERYGTKARNETVNDYLARVVREQDATKARAKSVTKEATAAGRAEGERAAERMGVDNPFEMAMAAPAIGMAQQAGARPVFDREGTMLPDEAAGLAALNTAGFFIPGMVNERFGQRVEEGRRQQPAAAFAGDVAGGMIGGELIGLGLQKAGQAIAPGVSAIGRMLKGKPAPAPRPPKQPPEGLTIEPDQKGLGGTYKAMLNGQKVGELVVDWRGPYVSLVKVDPAYQRSGIASALYDAAEADLGTAMIPSPLGISKSAQGFWRDRLERSDDPQGIVDQSIRLARENNTPKYARNDLESLKKSLKKPSSPAAAPAAAADAPTIVQPATPLSAKSPITERRMRQDVLNLEGERASLRAEAQAIEDAVDFGGKYTPEQRARFGEIDTRIEEIDRLTQETYARYSKLGYDPDTALNEDVGLVRFAKKPLDQITPEDVAEYDRVMAGSAPAKSGEVISFAAALRAKNSNRPAVDPITELGFGFKMRGKKPPAQDAEPPLTLGPQNRILPVDRPDALPGDDVEMAKALDAWTPPAEQQVRPMGSRGPLLTERGRDAVEQTFGAAYMSGTGSVAGGQYDLNGDGQIDNTDLAIGSGIGLAAFASPLALRKVAELGGRLKGTKPQGFVGGTPASGVYEMEPEDFKNATKGWYVKRGSIDGEEFAQVFDADGVSRAMVPATAGKRDADIIRETGEFVKPPAIRFPANDTPESIEMEQAILRALSDESPGDYVPPSYALPKDKAKTKWGDPAAASKGPAAKSAPIDKSRQEWISKLEDAGAWEAFARDMGDTGYTKHPYDVNNPRFYRFLAEDFDEWVRWNPEYSNLKGSGKKFAEALKNEEID